MDWRSAGITAIPRAEDYPDDPAVILLDEGNMEIIGSGELIRSVFERHTVIKVLGADKELVGMTAARIRSLRSPDVYKQKGIRYRGERLMKKVGKAAGK